MTAAAAVTAIEAIDALVAAEGDRYLAAERLGFCGPRSATVPGDRSTETPPEIGAARLTAIIASDPQAPMALNDRLRTLTVLSTFDLFSKTKVVIESDLSKLEPADLIKFFGALTTTLERITATATPTANFNVLEVAMRMLPAEVREAIISINGSVSPNAALGALPANVIEMAGHTAQADPPTPTPAHAPEVESNAG